MNALFLVMPGLPHRLQHGHDGVAEVQALLAAFPSGRWEGDRLALALGEGAVDHALAAIAREVAGLRLAGALCMPEAWIEGVPSGLEAHRGRQAVALAREGELLLTPRVGDVPEGVGRFEAPAALSQRVGATIEVARDYR